MGLKLANLLRERGANLEKKCSSSRELNPVASLEGQIFIHSTTDCGQPMKAQIKEI